MTQATPTEHSNLVGGSTAARRLNCPGSLARERKAPKSGGSSYAREGTALHEMMARILDRGEKPDDLLPFTHEQPPKGVEKAWSLTIDHDKWDDLGQPALDMFDGFLDALEAEEDTAANLMVEVSAEFPGIPGAFGTSDVPFRCGSIGGIWDWKFGRHKVVAEENDQLMFYFAALRSKYPKFFDGITRVQLCISQPQADDEKPDVWETDLERIDAFIDELAEAVDLAQRPDAPIEKGYWCDFADCKVTCELHVSAAKRLGEMMRRMDEDEAQSIEDPETPGQIADMPAFLSEAMDLAEMAESWAKAVAGITQEQLELGRTIPGWKIVAKKSAGREWVADEDVVVRRLQSRGLKAADYYNKKVISPTQAEKKLKPLGKKLPEDIVDKKPSSGYTLTRDGDPRPEAATRNGKAAAMGSALLKRLGAAEQNGD